MDETFDLDPTTRLCYIYDYFHDDPTTRDLCEFGAGYVPPEGSAKTPVKLKFLIKSYKSLAKDDPDYYIQFMMGDWNKVIEDPQNQTIVPEYFGEYKRFGVHYPIGLAYSPFLLNCWNPLKPTKPQRKNETYLSVMVTKVERIGWMT